MRGAGVRVWDVVGFLALLLCIPAFFGGLVTSAIHGPGAVAYVLWAAFVLLYGVGLSWALNAIDRRR